MKTLYVITPDMDPSNPRKEFDHLGLMLCKHSRYDLGDAKWEWENLEEYVFKNYQVSGTEQFDYYYDELRQYPTDAEQAKLEAAEGGEDWYDEMQQMVERYEPTQEGHKCFEAAIAKYIEENLCILPLYLYDHSGITMNTGGFGCRWDSGQVGWIIGVKEQFEKEGCNWEHAKEILEAEVKEYDQYLTGDVWGIVKYEIPDDAEVDLPAGAEEVREGVFMVTVFDGVDGDLDDFETDSCWGYFGEDYAEECVKEGYL